ncbi:MAG: hypothetical protein CBC38_06710 [Gammaproteobacteria bacterium TMED78]|nr:MAG: hypothetical protein CBC38_06710 [Gammaproteobacteria bacterium TMED78]|tara:strand:+ start:26934 stop:27962 length:1029 start_codon:yes stop_codon:yes gene_type:complete
MENKNKAGLSMYKLKILISALAFFITSAYGHHNWRQIYDINTDIEIVGVINSIEWRNPHIRVNFTVNSGTSEEQIYTTESNSVAALTRMELSPEILAPGTPVRVAGYRSRISESDIFMTHLLLPGNREVEFMLDTKPRWPEAEALVNTTRVLGNLTEPDFSKRPTSIFGVWSTVFYSEGSHRALNNDPIQWTEKGVEKNNESININNPRIDPSCSPKPMPDVMGAPYPIQIIDQGEIIIIHAEEFDSIREVHMNLPHDNAETSSILGYSTGRWIGETLSVATTFGSKSGMQIQETFHLSDDHNRLLYSQVIIDPEMRSMPTINKKWWQYQPGAFVQPYECSY